MGQLEVLIITPEKQVFEGTADALQYPGGDGLFGVLPGHAAMITTVAPGALTLKGGSTGGSCFVLARGFAEVRDNVVKFIVDSGEDVKTIDVERAQKAKDRAEKRLHAHGNDLDVARARHALQRAMARLKNAKR